MSIWNILIIVMVAVLILYIILDKVIMPVLRHRKNQKKAANGVLGHFFDPTTNLFEHILCDREEPYFVVAPESHRGFFPKLGGGNGKKDKAKEGTTLYSLIGSQTIGYTPEGKATEKPIRASVREMWPPDANEAEQVLVEAGFWVKGRMQALNPYNEFLPINTDKLMRTLKDEETAAAFAKISQRMLENWENIETAVKSMAKRMTWIMIGAFGSLLASGIGAVLAYLTYSLVKKL